MADSNISVLDLSLDAWAAIGRHLADSDLARASLACSSLHQHVMHNQTLWSYKFQERWGEKLQHLSGVHSWPEMYRASCLAATQFSTKNPWSVEVSRPYAAEPPAVSLVLVSSPSPSTASDSCIGEVMCFAASLDQKLLWLRTSNDARVLAADQLSQEEQYDVVQAELPNTAAAAADAVPPANSRQQKQQAALSCTLSSDMQHGHTAFIDALVEVPAGNNVGYASGSRDKTVKLWAPFSGNSCSSSSLAGHIRPVRTLRGHTGSITALLVLPAGGSCSCNNINSCCACAGSSILPLLASASADKTIRIWSLASLAPNNAAVSCSSEAGDDVTSQTVERDSSSSAGGSKSSLQRSTNAGKAAQQLLQQPSRNPLLATLRGHSDCVTDLMPDFEGRNCYSCKEFGSVNSGASKLLSCSRDCRIKQWDVNSQSCVATWKLPAPCLKLLNGFDVSNSCVAAMESHAITVLDMRVKGSTSGTGTAGVLRVQWPSGTLACAAAHGSMLAGGGRKGVRVWDVRAPPQGTDYCSTDNTTCSSSNISQGSNSMEPATLLNGKFAAGRVAQSGPRISSATSSKANHTLDSRVLFSASMPNNAPVSAIHLNRVRLVAATSKVVLHSPASIAVWSVPQGRRLQTLSSTESAVNVQAAGSSFWRNADYADDAWELIQALNEPDADEAIRLMHQQQQQQEQPPPAAQAHDNQWPPGVEQQQQPRPLHAAVAAVQPPAVDGAQAHSDSDDPHSDSDVESELSRGEAEAVHGGDDDGWATGSSASSGAAASSCYGRIEPGVVALAAHGQVMASVNTVGNILLRDFSKGQPRWQHLMPYCAAVGETSTSTSSNTASGTSSTSTASGSLADSTDGSNHGKQPPGDHLFNNGDEEARAAARAAAAAATGVEALHLSKFWRL